MGIYYQIVPIGDGLSYVGLDNDGNHIFLDKNISCDKGLLFKEKEEAITYIDNNLDKDKYKVERILLSV